MRFMLVSKGDDLRVEGDMTIYTSASAKDQLFTAVRERSGYLALDLSNVTDMDTAGLQILLLANRISVACGTSLRLENPSPIVREVLMLCGLMGLVEAGGEARKQA